MLSTGDIIQIQRQYRLIVKKRKNTYQANSNNKNAQVATLMSDKIDFKTNKKKILR